jgi:hypothetical protein
MRVMNLCEEAKRIEARRRALGIDPARIAVARNKGTARTATKRQLLRTLEDEARDQRRKPPFIADT